MTIDTAQCHGLDWAHRHEQIRHLSSLPAIVQAQTEALQAASLIQQVDDNAANAFAAHETSARLVDGRFDEAEVLGRSLDVSLAVLWSVPRANQGGRRHGHDHNATRQRALEPLRRLAAAALTESSRDLASIRCLESSREGTVELVRCRFNRQIYVLKSTTRGAAKRNYRTNAPMTERRLLSLAMQSCKGRDAFTPACIASFQSPGSLHILMEYCPAGDLYHFLESAGQAPVSNEARSKSGGLLAEEYVRKYATDMVAAISWLHGKGYMHRDLKPGNFLIDRSGHLLLCDLASAAPFALFDVVPASASLSPERGMHSTLMNQRRILHRHCCLIGTADYIAPEVFFAADLMSRRRMRHDAKVSNVLESPSQDMLTTTFGIDNDEEDDEPPPEGPGLYGPECDWWSLGVILFEMVYKRMPFFSDSIAETMEMIKNHKDYLSLDSWVRCSSNLKDLITQLMTHAEDRLGSHSSQEVQRHAFFKGVAWDTPWRDAAPFVPHLESDVVRDENRNLIEPEPSILHSPLPDQESRSFLARSFGASAIWDGDEDEDFPAFPNSVEHSRAAFMDRQQKLTDHAEKDVSGASSQSSDATVVDNSILALERFWAAFDPTWIGFTRVPSEDAFFASQDAAEQAKEAEVASESRTATASTPFVRRNRDGTTKTNDLHRHVLETASKARLSQEHFKTPVRKNSFSSLTPADATALKTPMSDTTAQMPSSPYPFPVASIARPKPTPSHPSALRRKDLDRARSASASTGEGSDSRCSGGSNAKRDISEREAWQELKVAVMQSARKTQQKNDHFRTHFQSSALESCDPRDGVDASGTESWPNRDSARKRVSFALRPGQNLLDSMARDRRLSILQDGTNRKALDPVLVMASPGDTRSIPSSTSSPISPNRRRIEASDDEPVDAADLSEMQGRLAKRKSARQLLLKAQHRETPTRTARPGSPFLQDEGGNRGASDGPELVTAVNAEVNLADQEASPVGQRSAVLQDYFTRQHRESTPQVLRGSKPQPSLQLARHHVVTHLKRQGTLQRRDSHETLSQYRLGINPDDFVELDYADSRKPGKRVLERQTSTVRADALRSNSNLSVLRESNVSSPTLPSLPDAFLGPGPLSSCSSNTSGSESQSQTSQSADAALQRRSLQGGAPRQAEDEVRTSLKGVREALKETRASINQPSNATFAGGINHAPMHFVRDRHGRQSSASPGRPTKPRPSLLSRASSYLKSLGQDGKRDENDHTLAPSPSPKKRSSPIRNALSKASQSGRGHASLPPPLPHGTYSVNTSSDSSATVTRLHARYDSLQAEIQDLERRLSHVRANLKSTTVQ